MNDRVICWENPRREEHFFPDPKAPDVSEVVAVLRAYYREIQQSGRDLESHTAANLLIQTDEILASLGEREAREAQDG